MRKVLARSDKEREVKYSEPLSQLFFWQEVPDTPTPVSLSMIGGCPLPPGRLRCAPGGFRCGGGAGGVTQIIMARTRLLNTSD